MPEKLIETYEVTVSVMKISKLGAGQISYPIRDGTLVLATENNELSARSWLVYLRGFAEERKQDQASLPKDWPPVE